MGHIPGDPVMLKTCVTAGQSVFRKVSDLRFVECVRVGTWPLARKQVQSLNSVWPRGSRRGWKSLVFLVLPWFERRGSVTFIMRKYTGFNSCFKFFCASSQATMVA